MRLFTGLSIHSAPYIQHSMREKASANLQDLQVPTTDTFGMFCMRDPWLAPPYMPPGDWCGNLSRPDNAAACTFVDFVYLRMYLRGAKRGAAMRRQGP